jgi:hypothetical protein
MQIAAQSEDVSRYADLCALKCSSKFLKRVEMVMLIITLGDCHDELARRLKSGCGSFEKRRSCLFELHDDGLEFDLLDISQCPCECRGLEVVLNRECIKEVAGYSLCRGSDGGYSQYSGHAAAQGNPQHWFR